MSWEPIVRGRSGSKTGIWCSLTDKHVRIMFFPDVFAALKLKDGARVEVCVGRDDHAGRIRLRVHDSGLTARKQAAKSNALAISFRRWDELAVDKCAPVQMTYKVVGDGFFEATLPYWGQPQKLKAKVVK